MKKVVVGLAAVVVLLLVAAVAVPLLVPLDEYKPAIASQLKEATGRDLRIDGPMRLSLFPRLALQLNDVGFSNAPGSEVKEMASLKELRLVLKLIPLLSGEVEVASFVLDHPVIELETDKNGRPNWVFGDALKRAKDAPEPGGATSLSLHTIDDVRILDGTFTWLNRRSGVREQVTGVSLVASMTSLDQPLEAEGKLTWKAKEVSLNVHVARPRDLLEGGASPVSARIDAETVSLGYSGEVANVTPLKVNGDIDLNVPSIRGLTAWAGSPVEGSRNTLGALHLTGRLALAGSKAAFADAHFGIDAVEATGSVSVDSSGTTPQIDGKLAIERLDLAPYVSPEPVQPAASEQRAAKSAEPDGGEHGIDLTGLQAVDANLDLSVGTMQMDNVRVDSSVLTAELKNGRLTIDLSRFAMNRGSGRGKLVLDGAHAETTGVAVTINLAGFDAETLLRDAADFDRISGTGVLDVTIASRGRSERELIEGAQGKGRIDLRGGAIKGIDLVAMVLHVASAFTLGDPAAKTEFSEMGGSFTIAGGVVNNSDMALQSPLLQVTGAGSIDLASHMVDYRVTPKLVTPLVGKLGLGTPGVMVPVLVRGPWDNLRYEPDLAGIIRQGLMAPVNVLEGVVNLPGALLGGQKQETPPDGQKQESAPSKAVDALKGLFGR